MKKVSLVLSGGGARGIAHIGVIEELISRGYRIESISGTSMGAVVGGVYALGKLDEFKNWLQSLDRAEVFRLMDFTVSSIGFIKGDRVFSKMKEFLPEKNIEDLDIHFSATAVDLHERKEVVFKKGNILEAMRASVAIPSVLTPVVRGKSFLVDGGVMNNVPISNVQRVENDLLMVVYLGASVPPLKSELPPKEIEKKESVYQKWINDFRLSLPSPFPKEEKEEQLGFFSVLNNTLDLMMHQIDKLNIEKYDPDVLIEISRDTCSLFDFYKAEELIQIGRKSTQQKLDDLGELQ